MSRKICWFQFLVIYTQIVLISSRRSPVSTLNASQRKISLIPAELGRVYQNQTSIYSELHYVYQLDKNQFPPKSVRLRTERIRGGSEEQPIRINVRQNEGSQSWQIPFQVEKYEFDHVERTLCLSETETSSQEITVIISTSSQSNLLFEIVLNEIEDFEVKINKEIKIKDLDYATPDYRYIDLANVQDDAILQVKVTSEEEVCGIVSVQPSSCPVSDTENTVRYEGAFQTMLELSAFSINLKDGQNGVFIAFIVTANDDICGLEKASSQARRIKNFKFEITDTLSKTKLGLEIGLSTGLLFTMGVITMLATCLYSVYRDTKNLEKRLLKLQVVAKRVAQVEEVELQVQQESRQRSSTGSGDDASSHIPDYEEARLPRYVNELATMEDASPEDVMFYKTMFYKTDLYIWLVLMMGIFYGIPAIQLVMTFQEKFFISGDQDLCYYNFLCSIPTSRVKDFNHIYSNIWYMGFGCLFVFLTWFRKKQHLRFLAKWDSIENGDSVNHKPTDYGLPQHFGIFYAMGFSLIFEGVLSACYHVCPTPENFQFDTTFMYVMATLTFIKIYQFRHPDVTSNAYKVFFGLGLVMFMEVMGIFYESTAFWVVFLLGYLILSMILTSIIYHAGSWSFDYLLFHKMYLSLRKFGRNRKCENRQSNRTLILLMILNILNVVFIILGAVFTPGISSYILGIFICNLLIYTFYYFIMKLISKERITLPAYIYLFFSLLCWIPALYFYRTIQTSYLVSPAQSRNLNQDCTLMELFDNHDIWHMLSAGGLFFCFMLLQTLDDGLFYVPRSTIKIF